MNLPLVTRFSACLRPLHAAREAVVLFSPWRPHFSSRPFACCHLRRRSFWSLWEVRMSDQGGLLGLIDHENIVLRCNIILFTIFLLLCFHSTHTDKHTWVHIPTIYEHIHAHIHAPSTSFTKLCLLDGRFLDLLSPIMVGGSFDSWRSLSYDSTRSWPSFLRQPTRAVIKWGDLARSSSSESISFLSFNFAFAAASSNWREKEGLEGIRLWIRCRENGDDGRARCSYVKHTYILMFKYLCIIIITVIIIIVVEHSRILPPPTDHFHPFVQESKTTRREKQFWLRWMRTYNNR